RRRHTRSDRDWSSDVCSSDLFAVFAAAGTSPAAFSARMSISAIGSWLKSDNRTSAVNSRNGDTKPRLGRRRWSGIWPPSKPTLWKPPVRDFWPLLPRPAVLPEPLLLPRPTRCRVRLLPAAGLIVFIRIAFVLY